MDVGTGGASGPDLTPSRQPLPLTIARIAGKTLIASVLIYCLLLAVGLLATGFKTASGGSDIVERLLTGIGSNPLLGLVIGIFATALVQSSSTVTTVIIGLVASGQLPVATAVPMVMGANIGTTVTNTIVSLAHVTRPQEFRRAFAAATVHDFFNFLAVGVFLSVELLIGCLTPSGRGILEILAGHMADFCVGGTSIKGEMSNLKFVKHATKPVIHLFYAGPDHGLFGAWSNLSAGVALSLCGIGAIFGSIYALGRFMKRNMIGRAERIFHYALGRSAVTGILSGTVITSIVQSSSTTTSLIVPMAGSGMLSLKRILPFTLGANIGTCVTGLLAALGGTPAALQVAFVHLLFNTSAVVVIYGLPFLRSIPLWAARRLAEVAVRRRWLALLYVGCIFFLLPLLILGAVKLGEAVLTSETTTPAPAPHARP